MRANLLSLMAALLESGWLAAGAAVIKPQAATLEGAFQLVRESVQKKEVPGAIALVVHNGW